MIVYLAGQNHKRHIIPFVHGGYNENISCKDRVEALAYNRAEQSRADDMKLYLARVAPWRENGLYNEAIHKHKPYILESYYYADDVTEKLLEYYGDFMLDSGAFTFMQNSKSHLNWDEYIERYAAFVRRNNVNKFFELDIDSVVGYEQVKKYRKRLEKLSGKRCIPVWHKSRGVQEFKRMCDEYDYVAIGGIVSKEIRPEHYKILPNMINEAHSRKAKIHGLGFTSLKWLEVCKFDSVDSTAWTAGNRFGFVYKFNGRTMTKIDCPKGKRLADSRKVALINYIEWLKFQKYAEENL